jgi:nucleoside-diphosphate-sugar epimerase
MNVLVTGGAGYKGVCLIEKLLEAGHKVTCLDNFMYGYTSVLGFAANPLFSVNKMDIRNVGEKDTCGYDIIYHLAGISGYPACEANPHSAQTINVDSTRRLVDTLSAQQLLVYASTTSMYAQGREGLDENAVINAHSLYGKTKYEAEKLCMERDSSISFRFATIFGVSRKMRTDLMLNDFVYKAVTERSIVLFDSKSIRTFLHIQDAIAAYLMVLEKHDAMRGNIFNVGSDSMNYSKMQIAQTIKEMLPDVEIVDSSLADPDRRDFIINYAKLNALGFEAQYTLQRGIEELVRLYSWFRHYNPFQII